jgi:hypothetical protein
MDTLVNIYDNVQVATENDSCGRSRKMVRKIPDREDLSSDELDDLLRVLEWHDLVVLDGNRWRKPRDE